MKKYFVFIVLFFLIGGISAQAQAKFGIKAGVNVSNISFKLDEALDTFEPDNLTGFQVGPMLEFMSPLGLGVDVAVLYSQQGFKVDLEKYKLNTLQVPVNLKLKIALLPKVLKVYGNTGPNISLNLSDKLKDQIKTKSFGFGWNFGFGLELIQHLQVGANYQLGLTNDYSDFEFGLNDVLNLKGKPSVWSISAAYLF